MADLEINRCALLGYELKESELKPITGLTLEYETEYVGKVKITLIAYNELLQGDFEKYVIAGICKNRTLSNQEPILIDSNFIREGYKKMNPPLEFDEKCFELNKTLFQLFGKENREFELHSGKHSPLGYCDPEEFSRLVDQLKTDYSIDYRKVYSMGGHNGTRIYMGAKMTNIGKEEAKKTLPKMPLFGLVNQTISTGDIARDEKLNHARELFFAEPQSLDNMRSACEALSFILEPLRNDLKNYFSSKDVSDFFQIVNTFDIRHNKTVTNKITEPEQLEWVFYSLLNTINTYSKLKASGK